ncbi:MAG: hypothetical protein SFU27_00490, partial [Thermonemataceae bacterium]|nr:hypothetical protein [Thermonemataceae bacterium]
QLSEYSDREKYKTSRFYNEDGDIVFEAQYIDNQLNGEVNLYNIEQHLWERKYYEKGRKNGKSFSYYDKKREKICVEAHYQQDVLEGSYQEFDKTGKLKLKGQYQKGKKVGKWYFYDEKNKETIKVF